MATVNKVHQDGAITEPLTSGRVERGRSDPLADPPGLDGDTPEAGPPLLRGAPERGLDLAERRRPAAFRAFGAQHRIERERVLTLTTTTATSAGNTNSLDVNAALNEYTRENVPTILRTHRPDIMKWRNDTTSVADVM